MKRVVITYIGGGSKDWAHKYFSDILSQDDLSGELRLYDINVPAAEKNKKYFDRLQEDNKPADKRYWTCRVDSDIDTTLKGADFVLLSILPYSFNAMKVDVHYPEKYGILQSVGDTTGPGGYSRAMRTIPFYQFFGKKIKENCPDAWVINYTNPMAMCVNTLYKEFPEIKAFGCCHEVFGTQFILAGIMTMFQSLSEEGKKSFMSGELKPVLSELEKQGKGFESFRMHEGIPRDEIKLNVQGINHFTWVNKAMYKDIDIFPIYTAFIKLFRQYNSKRLGPFVPLMIKQQRNRFSLKFELFERYGVMGAAGDRHLAEFVPADYLVNRRKIRMDGFFITPVWGRIIFDKFKVKKLNSKIKSKKPLKIHQSGEEGVIQITALAGLKSIQTNINVPNRGQAPDLPLGTAVETNAVLSGNKAEPVNAGAMKPEVLNLVKVHAENQKNFVDAFFKKDKKGLLEVFLNDPAVKRISREDGTKLFNEMIELNKECLEDWLTK
jgi:alpha-galactosidase